MSISEISVAAKTLCIITPVVESSPAPYIFCFCSFERIESAVAQRTTIIKNLGELLQGVILVSEAFLNYKKADVETPISVLELAYSKLKGSSIRNYFEIDLE